MNGVQVGTRLERLLALRKRVNTEIVMLGYREPTMPPEGGLEVVARDPLVLVPLSHVEKAKIRAWAGGDPHRRGTLPLATIAAYAAAHRPGAHR